MVSGLGGTEHNKTSIISPPLSIIYIFFYAPAMSTKKFSPYLINNFRLTAKQQTVQGISSKNYLKKKAKWFEWNLKFLVQFQLSAIVSNNKTSLIPSKDSKAFLSYSCLSIPPECFTDCGTNKWSALYRKEMPWRVGRTSVALPIQWYGRPSGKTGKGFTRQNKTMNVRADRERNIRSRPWR